jgi:hypothetical protein
LWPDFSATYRENLLASLSWHPGGPARPESFLNATMKACGPAFPGTPVDSAWWDSFMKLTGKPCGPAFPGTPGGPARPESPLAPRLPRRPEKPNKKTFHFCRQHTMQFLHILFQVQVIFN